MTKPIKYDFYSDCGGSFIETFTTTYPAAYADELAALRNIDRDEITWEQAEGTVDDFDAFFPPEITNGERARLQQVTAYQYEIDQASASLDAMDIPPGKLHERVGSALESLRAARWQAGHYKALYEARLKRLEVTR